MYMDVPSAGDARRTTSVQRADRTRRYSAVRNCNDLRVTSSDQQAFSPLQGEGRGLKSLSAHRE